MRAFSLLPNRRRERELEAELRFHLDQQTAQNIASGMTPDEARRAAAIEFGGLDKTKEECRDVRRFAWAEALFQDFRYALRQLLHAPGFAAASILTVAIGISACASVFSLVNGVLLKPLRFPDPEQIVLINETRPPNEELPLAPAVYLDWAAQASAFGHIAVHRPHYFNTSTAGRSVSVGADAITANFFSVLGVAPLLGRSFLAEEETEGKNHVLILSYGAWQQYFGGKENVLGQTMLLDDQPFTIVGVMPDRNLIWNVALFVPITFSTADRSDYGSHGLFCVARMKPGTTAIGAQADMVRVADQIARAHPSSNAGHSAQVHPILREMIGGARGQLLVLLAAVGLVLLIACVNVSNLLLARANCRQKEIAVRATLGATRGRIVRQFLCESLLIVALGGALGTMAAYAGMGALAHFAGRFVPRSEEIALDGGVLVALLSLILVAGLGVGVVPALQFTRGDLTEALKDSGRGSTGGRKRQRIRTVLVVGEIALAMILLATTGLLARSLMAMQTNDQGFRTEGVYFSSLSLSGKKYDSSEKIRSFIDQAVEKTMALPGIDSIAFTNGLPMVSGEGLLFSVVGTPPVPTKDMPQTQAFAVTPLFFRTLGIPIIQGRGFTAKDTAGSPRVVIINRELARRHFAGVDPIGQRLMIMTMADAPDVEREIVGVVGDIKPDGPRSSLRPQVYEPYAQRPSPWANLILKTKNDGGDRPAGVGETIRALDSDLPFEDLRQYRSAIANSWVSQRFSMLVFTVFSAIALLLAVIGIYGVMAYSVSQRTQEIGIRMALGGRARDILLMVGRRGAMIVSLGLLIGTAGSLASGRFVRALLFETSPFDPLTLLAVALLLGGVALFACWMPARRATKVDPVVALRSE